MSSSAMLLAEGAGVHGSTETLFPALLACMLYLVQLFQPSGSLLHCLQVLLQEREAIRAPNRAWGGGGERGDAPMRPLPGKRS